MILFTGVLFDEVYFCYPDTSSFTSSMYDDFTISASFLQYFIELVYFHKYIPICSSFHTALYWFINLWHFSVFAVRISNMAWCTRIYNQGILVRVKYDPSLIVLIINLSWFASIFLLGDALTLVCQHTLWTYYLFLMSIPLPLDLLIMHSTIIILIL